MNETVAFRLDKKVKNEYYDYIKEEYGQKWGKTGKSIGTLMKFELTVHGGVSYVDDPEVQELLESARDFSSTHTQNSKDHNKEPNNDRIQRLEEKIDQLQVQLVQAMARDNNNTNEANETSSTREERVQKDVAQKQVRYRENKMDQFVSAFFEEYGNYQQVSMKEIQKLVMNVHGVTDKRSIQNRVEYLVASGCIENYAPNVYNVRF